jgi:transcriptional regulator with XRE-family HTH domain
VSNIQLAANLQRLRKDHHFTQTQFSKKLNISRQAYSNYETGKRIPDLDIIIRIANIYHISRDYEEKSVNMIFYDKNGR